MRYHARDRPCRDRFFLALFARTAIAHPQPSERKPTMNGPGFMLPTNRMLDEFRPLQREPIPPLKPPVIETYTPPVVDLSPAPTAPVIRINTTTDINDPWPR